MDVLETLGESRKNFPNLIFRKPLFDPSVQSVITKFHDQALFVAVAVTIDVSYDIWVFEASQNLNFVEERLPVMTVSSLDLLLREIATITRALYFPNFAECAFAQSPFLLVVDIVAFDYFLNQLIKRQKY